MLFIHSFVYRLIDCDRLLSAAQLNEFPLRQAHTHTPLLYATFAPLCLKGFLGHVSGSHHRSSLSCSSMTCSLLIAFTPPLPLALVSLSMKKRDGSNERKEDKYTASFKMHLGFKGLVVISGAVLGCEKLFSKDLLSPV